MRQSGGKTMSWSWCLAAVVGLALTGCATGYSIRDDVRVIAKGDRFYLLTRDSAVARAICLDSGLASSRWEPPRFADGGRFALPDARVRTGILGCYISPRHIIVCAEGDEWCLLHEERHAREGDFHD